MLSQKIKEIITKKIYYQQEQQLLEGINDT